jgi:hypothetical protein
MEHLSGAWASLDAPALAVMMWVAQSPGPEWTRAKLEAHGGPEGVEALILAGWLVEWGGVLTLSPWGAHQSRRTLVERAECYPVWTDWDPETGEIADEPTYLRAARGEHERPLWDWMAEVIADARPGPAEAVELLMDGWTGEPVKLFGQVVPIDPRLGPKRVG